MLSSLSRRELLRTAVGGTVALGLSSLARLAAAEAKQAAYQLPKLPYAYDALEPYIDARTMEIHHDKHHQGYVNKLNKALDAHPQLLGTPIEKLLRDIDRVPADVRTAVINNGGGNANHTLFWQVMAPKAGGSPKGELARAIDDAFGSFDKFQAKLSEVAAKRFGSGWAWLVLDKGKLTVLSSANQDSPLMKGQTPILGIDVWEHAYYLKYQNRRPEYVKAWWHVVNWDNVAERYAQARKG